MKSNKSVLKLRTCEVVQQWEFMDIQTEEELRQRIQSMTQIRRWSFITHDKDTDENGNLKPRHFHAVLSFANAKTVDSIAKAIGVPSQYVASIRGTTSDAEKYLTHSNAPNKAQYLPDAVYASYDYSQILTAVPVTERLASLINGIANGSVKQYNITDHVSATDYAKYKPQIDRAFEYRFRMLKGVDRDMQCIFISGTSGVGKTTFAKKMAETQKFSAYVSSGGKNPLDDYAGQECIILDDVRSETFPLADFLKLTDNHTDSLVGCRYYNKSIGECKLLIVTSVVPLNEFYKAVTDKEKEPRKQLLRRFSIVYDMTPDIVHCYNYDDDRCTHVYAGKIVNPVSFKYSREKALKFTRDLASALGVEFVSDVVLTSSDGEPISFETLSDTDDLPFGD